MSKPRSQAERVSELRENIGGTGGKLIRCTAWLGHWYEKQRLSNQNRARNPLMGMPALALDTRSVLVAGTRRQGQHAQNAPHLGIPALAIREMA
jgi:hypothetical protein